MFSLPICPHCKAVYHYKDTKKAVKQKQNTCYHCQKSFSAHVFPGILIPAIVFAVLNVLLNIYMLMRMTSLNLILLFAVTLLFIGIVYVLIPFFVLFKKADEKKTKKKK